MLVPADGLRSIAGLTAVSLSGWLAKSESLKVYLCIVSLGRCFAHEIDDIECRGSPSLSRRFRGLRFLRLESFPVCFLLLLRLDLPLLMSAL